MNCRSLMCKRLPGYIYELLRSLGRTGEEMGHRAFVVGGFVRDLLIGRPNLDVDVVVEGDGIAFAQTVADDRNGEVKCHRRFGTAVVKLPDDFKIDFATARTEVYECPGVLPSVQALEFPQIPAYAGRGSEQSSIEDDLRRRDFTINAMAIELNENRFGELVDFFGGRSDLEGGLVRILHDLSFVDDPTRIFRAVRFEQRYGFSIEPHTQELLERAVAGDSPGTITKQRLRNEILLILKEDAPVMSIRRMSHFGLIKYIHPHIYLSDEMVELFHRVKEVLAWWDSMLSSRSVSKFASTIHNKADAILGSPSTRKKKENALLLNLMALLDQLDIAEVDDVCRRLVLRKKYVDALNTSKRRLSVIFQVIGESKDQPSRIYENLKGLPLEVLLFAMAKADIMRAGRLKHRDGVRDSISFYLTNLRKVKSLVNGNDLRELGYAEGPLYTEILDRAFAAQLDGLIVDKTQAMQFIKSEFPLYSHG